MVLLDVLHNITVLHPLRHSDKLSLLYVPQDTRQFQNIRMSQRVPKDGLLTKTLGNVVLSGTPSDRKKKLLLLTFLRLNKSLRSGTLKVLTATRRPLYVPVLTSAKLPAAITCSET